MKKHDPVNEIWLNESGLIAIPPDIFEAIHAVIRAGQPKFRSLDVIAELRRQGNVQAARWIEGDRQRYVQGCLWGFRAEGDNDPHGRATSPQKRFGGPMRGTTKGSNGGNGG